MQDEDARGLVDAVRDDVHEQGHHQDQPPPAALGVVVAPDGRLLVGVFVPRLVVLRLLRRELRDGDARGQVAQEGGARVGREGGRVGGDHHHAGVPRAARVAGARHAGVVAVPAVAIDAGQRLGAGHGHAVASRGALLGWRRAPKHDKVGGALLQAVNLSAERAAIVIFEVLFSFQNAAERFLWRGETKQTPIVMSVYLFLVSVQMHRE